MYSTSDILPVDLKNRRFLKWKPLKIAWVVARVLALIVITDPTTESHVSLTKKLGKLFVLGLSSGECKIR